MATTAKKTSKKPPKKATASKVKTTKPAAVKTTKKALGVQHLYQLNLYSLAVSLITAVGSALLLVSTSVQLWMSYMTRDEVADQTRVVLAPAARVVTEVELRYLLWGIFVISTITSLLLVTSLKKKYEAALSGHSSPLRWLFIGISSALLLEFVSILAGVSDVSTLKLVGVLILVTVFLGWTSEHQNQNAKTPQWSAYGVSLLTGSFFWRFFRSFFGGGSHE